MNLVIFITRRFCGDKEKGPPLLRFVGIDKLKSFVYGTRNKFGYQIVSYINILMNNVERL